MIIYILNKDIKARNLKTRRWYKNDLEKTSFRLQNSWQKEEKCYEQMATGIFSRWWKASQSLCGLQIFVRVFQFQCWVSYIGAVDHSKLFVEAYPNFKQPVWLKLTITIIILLYFDEFIILINCTHCNSCYPDNNSTAIIYR